VFKKLLLINLLFVGACSLQYVKDEKYISTKPFVDEAFKICMDSKKYKKEPQDKRKAICTDEAQATVKAAEDKFRKYKADEHNYRLCRSKFADMQVSDKCFNQQQEKYYGRELDSYKASLN